MKTVYLLFILAFLLSCSPSNDNNYSLEQIKFSQEYISLDDSLELKFIPLETTDSCLIGSISNIQIRNNLIFVLEGRKSEDLFVFDMNGKFIARVGKKGAGPGQYIRIADFDIDEDRQLIVLADMHQEHLLFYDLDSYQFKYSLKTDFYYNQFCSLPDGKVLFYGCNGFENPDNINDRDPYYLLKTDSLMNQEACYWKADFVTPYRLLGMGKNNIYRYNNEIHVYHHLFPSIWKYKTDRIEPAYTIELDGYSFPNTQFLNEESKISDKQKDYTQALSNSDFVTNYVINECSDMISLSIQKNNVPIQALYNKKSKKGYILPLKDYYRSLNLGMLMFPIGATNEYIIGYIQMNEDIIQVKENMKLYKYIENKNPDENPILCLYKWKSN